jgi:DTW domain-containing protein YfiP
VRDFCFGCRKSKVTCFCDRVRPFESDPQLAILIHPREARSRVGTGRMLHLSLTNSILIDGHDFEGDERVEKLIRDPALHCALLYPGPGSLDLTSCTAEEARGFTPAGKRLVLFLIDGTWDQARGMVNRSPNLKALPQIRFTPSAPSAYEFRRQPRDFCFSTLEAAHWIIDRFATLGVTERPTGDAHHGLIECFKHMVRQQVRYAERNHLRRTEGMRRGGPPPVS